MCYVLAGNTARSINIGQRRFRIDGKTFCIKFEETYRKLKVIGPRKMCIDIKNYITETRRTAFEHELTDLNILLDTSIPIVSGGSKITIDYCSQNGLIPVFPYGYAMNKKDNYYNFTKNNNNNLLN